MFSIKFTFYLKGIRVLYAEGSQDLVKRLIIMSNPNATMHGRDELNQKTLAKLATLDPQASPEDIIKLNEDWQNLNSELSYARGLTWAPWYGLEPLPAYEFLDLAQAKHTNIDLMWAVKSAMSVFPHLKTSGDENGIPTRKLENPL